MLTVEPFFVATWHSKRSDAVSISGVFESPRALLRDNHDGDTPREPPCSVTLLDEFKMVWGTTSMIPKSKQLSVAYGRNVVYSTTNTAERLSLVCSQSRTKLHLRLILHHTNFPHAPTTTLDLTDVFWLCCSKLCVKPHEIGVRRGAVRRSPIGLLVCLIIANATGSTFLVRICTHSHHVDCLPLDAMMGSSSYLDIELHASGPVVVCYRADIGAPTVDVPPPVPNVALFETMYVRPFRTSLLESSHKRTVQVRISRIQWGEHAFTSTLLESEAFDPPAGTIVALFPQCHPCPLLVESSHVTLLAAPGDRTHIVRIPKAALWGEQVTTFATLVQGLVAPMQILQATVAGLDVYLILSEDGGLHAVLKDEASHITVNVAKASLVHGLAANRLVLPSTDGDRLSLRMEARVVSPGCILVSDGVVGALMRLHLETPIQPMRSLRAALRSPGWSQSQLERTAIDCLKRLAEPTTLFNQLMTMAETVSLYRTTKSDSNVLSLISGVAEVLVPDSVTSTEHWLSLFGTLCRVFSTHQVALPHAMKNRLVASYHQHSSAIIPQHKDALSTQAAVPIAPITFRDEFLGAIAREGTLAMSVVDQTIARLVRTVQLSTGSWSIEATEYHDVLRVMGWSLLCRCLDVSCILTIQRGRLTCVAAVRDASGYLMQPAPFESADDFDRSLALAADLLCVHDASEEFPLDAILLALLCNHRLHAVETVVQLLPTQWEAVCNAMRAILSSSTSDAAFTECCSFVNAQPTEVLEHLLSRSVSTSLAQRVLWVLSAFACRRPTLEVLQNVAPVDVFSFLHAVVVHHETEKLVFSAQQCAVHEVQAYLPSATTLDNNRQLHDHHRVKRAQAIEACTATVSAVSDASKKGLLHGLLHPASRGRGATIAQRTLERDVRALCLVSSMLNVESSLAARCKESESDRTRDAVVAYAAVAVQSHAALHGTLIPTEVLQTHAVRASERCAAAAVNQADGVIDYSLLVLAKEVLEASGALHSDVMTMKRSACQLHDRILRQLEQQPSDAPPTAQYVEDILNITKNVPKDDVRRSDCIRSAVAPWSMEALLDGRHAFLVNTQWLDALWPVEYYRDDWYPIVEAVINTRPSAAHTARPQLSPMARRAMFATVSTIAPPLRAYLQAPPTTTVTAPPAAAPAPAATTPATAQLILVTPAVKAPAAAPSPVTAAPAAVVSPQDSIVRLTLVPPPLPTPQLPAAQSVNVVATSVEQAKPVTLAVSEPKPASAAADPAPATLESKAFTAANVAWWEEPAASITEVAVGDIALSFPALHGDGAESDNTSYSNATTMTSTNAHRRRAGSTSSSSSSDSRRRGGHRHRHHHHSRRHHRHHNNSGAPHVCSKHRQTALLTAINRLPQPNKGSPSRPALHTTVAATATEQPIPVVTSEVPRLALPSTTHAGLNVGKDVGHPQQNLAAPPSIHVPPQLHLGEGHLTEHRLHLVDPNTLTANTQQQSQPRVVPPPPLPPSTMDDVAQRPRLQPPPIPASVAFPTGSGYLAPPSVGWQPGTGWLAPPQLLVAPTRSSRKRGKHSSKKRTQSSSSSSSSDGRRKSKRHQQPPPPAHAASPTSVNASVNHGKVSARANVMQSEDLNRLYDLLLAEVALPPGEVMYRGADNTMRLATAPGGIEGSTLNQTTLPPSEQAKFRAYIDDLMLHNRTNIVPPTSYTGMPSSSRPPFQPTSTATQQEEFLQQLAAQQHAMFQVQQEMLTQQQRENNVFLRRFADTATGGQQGGPLQSTYPSFVQQSGPASPLRSSHGGPPGAGGAHSPMRTASASAVGLSALQQAQLVEDTMDYRKRVLQLSEELLKLQSKVMQQPASSGLPTPVNNNTQVQRGASVQTSMAWPPPPLAGVASHAAYNSVGVGNDRYDTVTTHAGVQTHGLQRAPTPPRPGSVAASTTGWPPHLHQPNSNQSIDAARSSLLLLNSELARFTQLTNDVEKGSAELAELLRRSSMHNSASEFVSEQQAAIDALRRKAVSIQNELLSKEPPRNIGSGGSHAVFGGGASIMGGIPPTMNNSVSAVPSVRWLGESQAPPHQQQGDYEMVRMNSEAFGVGATPLGFPVGGYGPTRGWEKESEAPGSALGPQHPSYTNGQPQSQAMRQFLEVQETADNNINNIPAQERHFQFESEAPAEDYQPPRYLIGQQQSMHQAPLDATMINESVVLPHNASIHGGSSPRRSSPQRQQRSPQRPRSQAGHAVPQWEPLSKSASAYAGVQFPHHSTARSPHDLGALFDAAKQQGDNKRHTGGSASPSRPSTVSGKVKAKQSTTNHIPSNLKMYATGAPTTTARTSRSRTPEASPNALRQPSPAAKIPATSTVVLQDKRTLSVGDKYAEKQRLMLEAHTKARIAAVKNALR